jgi:hypothetical protein
LKSIFSVLDLEEFLLISGENERQNTCFLMKNGQKCKKPEKIGFLKMM